MRPLACLYSIIQFVPFVETGEFANIGIVLTCPKTKFFGFLLQDKRSKRITDFFEELERGYYKRVVKAINEELELVQSNLLHEATAIDADVVRGAFAALTQPREAIVRFSNTRVLLCSDPAQTLQEKFDHYVDHSFVTQEYIEKTMNNRLKDLLCKMKLTHPFKPARIGNDLINAKFDFVQTVDGVPKKIIKALNLAQKDANDIAAHGDVWAGKISRLQRHQETPMDVLFNVELPSPDEGARYSVGLEIMKELEKQRIVVVSGHDHKAIHRIQEFAAH